MVSAESFRHEIHTRQKTPTLLQAPLLLFEHNHCPRFSEARARGGYRNRLIPVGSRRRLSPWGCSHPSELVRPSPAVTDPHPSPGGCMPGRLGTSMLEDGQRTAGPLADHAPGSELLLPKARRGLTSHGPLSSAVSVAGPTDAGREGPLPHHSAHSEAAQIGTSTYRKCPLEHQTSNRGTCLRPMCPSGLSLDRAVGTALMCPESHTWGPAGGPSSVLGNQ